MLDILLDALLDSLKVFLVAFVLYIIISFIEGSIARILGKKNRLSPLFGSLLGIIPQCGLGVVASDLYQKRHITMGTLIALFITCSDEALPILISSGKKALMILPLLLIKIIAGFVVGFLVDLIYTKTKHDVLEHKDACNHHLEEDVHIGCCHHKIEDTKEESNIHKHLLHPLIHSLKIFVYVLIINILFGTIIYIIGEDTLVKFLQTNKYIAPLLTTLIGVIPNCAASVIITEVYLLNGISFGACLSGLVMNAGLGLVFLFKKKEAIKENFIIIGVMIATSLILGYATCLIMGF